MARSSQKEYSVSLDVELRRSIAKIATEQSNLIRGVATAQMQLELQNRVMAVERKHRDTLIENTGVEPFLTEEDMNGYLEQVLIAIICMDLPQFRQSACSKGTERRVLCSRRRNTDIA